jgi:type IV secretion system protein VirB4
MRFLTKHYRNKEAGVADLLNWAALTDEGIVQCKDGSVLAGFFFRGPDLFSSTDIELNDLTRRVNNALVRFGSGWAMWAESVRLPTSSYSDRSKSHFPDPITQLIDDERRHHFETVGEFYETEYAVILSYTPPLQRNRKIVDMMYDNAPNDAGPEGSSADVILKQFERQLGEFQDAIGETMRMRRMRSFTYQDPHGFTHMSDELVNYLNYTLTGDEGVLNIPEPAMYLDAYIGGQDLHGGFNPKIGSKYVSCVAIEGFPSYSTPGMLDLLDHLAIPYRWSSRFLFMDQHESKTPLGKEQRGWAQQSRGFLDQVFKTQNGRINVDAIRMANEIDAAIVDADSGMVSYGYYTPLIVLMDEDLGRLQANAKIVAKEIRKRGFATRVEEINALDAWMGSLPGHTMPNVRRPLMHTLSLADLLPLSSAWPGLANNPCDLLGYGPNSPPLLQGATTGSTPFRLNLHVGDLGHTFIIGPTGSGKSVLLNSIAASALRYEGVQIMAFDKDFSMQTLCMASGGTHYTMAGEGSPGLCPLRDISTPLDLAWAAEWLASCYELQVGHAPTPLEKKAIFHALSVMQSSLGRSLSDFCNTVQDDNVRNAIGQYTLQGPYGYLVDAVTDDLALNRFVVIEIGELLKLGPKIAVPTITLLSKRFEAMLDGRPAYLIFDEAWVMLGEPVFASKIEDILRTYRKKNCAWVGATQSLGDLSSSGIMEIINTSCSTKIFLPNPAATHEQYKSYGVNERGVQIIREGEQKEDYYVISRDGRRVFSLVLGPITLSFVGVSDPAQLSIVNRLAAQLGPQWPWAWLDYRGVKYSHLLKEKSYAA